MSFGKIIIGWYRKYGRDLPWRNTHDPYFIWLSEIILQQTRVDQGLSYYHAFTEKFPDVRSLATAKEDDVLKLWQGLGYYSRARNLHAAANQVVKDFSGKFPSDYDSIRSLKGVGEYTAAAISSFAFGKKYPVVDGNVFRLLSRYLGIFTPIDTIAGKKEFTAIAGELMGDFDPADFNQAIMEFGARQCRPANPGCDDCPLNAGCYSYKHKTSSSLPVKKNKTKSKKRYFNYLVIRKKNSFFIRKRTGNDIWKGLHDFPLIETKKRLSETSVLQSGEWRQMFGKIPVTVKSVSIEYKHVLSHQDIHAKFYEVVAEAKSFKEPEAEWKLVTEDSVRKYAVPRLIEKYLEEKSKVNPDSYRDQSR